MPLLSKLLDTLFPARKVARTWGIGFLGRDDLQVTLGGNSYRVSCDRLLTGPVSRVVHWQRVSQLPLSGQSQPVSDATVRALRAQIEGYFAELSERVEFDPVATPQ